MADEKLTSFTLKNERRREAKKASSATYRQGRQNRRNFAWKGAFGIEVARVYNDCVIGTSARTRVAKASKEELDDNADYDQ